MNKLGSLKTQSLLLLLILSCLSANAQDPVKDPAPAASDQKAEQIVNRAIEVLGGTSYLNVRTVIGRGFYTPFHEGASQIPVRFVDYIVYPDKERTEFGSGVRTIQVNFGDQGWLFDGAAKTLNDQKPEQIADFKFQMGEGDLALQTFRIAPHPGLLPGGEGGPSGRVSARRWICTIAPLPIPLPTPSSWGEGTGIPRLKAARGFPTAAGRRSRSAGVGQWSPARGARGPRGRRKTPRWR